MKKEMSDVIKQQIKLKIRTIFTKNGLSIYGRKGLQNELLKLVLEYMRNNEIVVNTKVYRRKFTI